MTIISRGQRYRLTKDFADLNDRTFKKGQTGRAIGVGPERAAIEFDGYEEQKELHHQGLLTEDVADDVEVTWLAEVPLALLETADN